MPEPIERIEWLAAKDLKANDYNPNVVFTPELNLLALSLLRTGWIQPLLISADHTLIDGFHRWRLAQDHKELHAKYGGLVPCVVLPLERAEAIAMTVRINRAKGSHVAVRLASLVKELIAIHDWDPRRVAQEIGASAAEVELLLQEGVFTARDIPNYRYSKAWYPVEVRSHGPAQPG